MIKTNAGKKKNSYKKYCKKSLFTQEIRIRVHKKCWILILIESMRMPNPGLKAADISYLDGICKGCTVPPCLLNVASNHTVQVML
jgi:hypothetical protein